MMTTVTYMIAGKKYTADIDYDLEMFIINLMETLNPSKPQKLLTWNPHPWLTRYEHIWDQIYKEQIVSLREQVITFNNNYNGIQRNDTGLN